MSTVTPSNTPRSSTEAPILPIVKKKVRFTVFQCVAQDILKHKNHEKSNDIDFPKNPLRRSARLTDQELKVIREKLLNKK